MLMIKEHQTNIDIQPLVDIAIKHQHENPQDAVQLLNLLNRLSPAIRWLNINCSNCFVKDLVS
ncbi:hypothetical protein ACT691_05445 [Vibrio metschnikovii]